jgi:hypothetical protein
LKPSARFAFLISLARDAFDGLLADLKAAAFAGSQTEIVTSRAIETLRNLEAAYGRHKRALRHEIGGRYLRGLLDEVVSLRRGMEAGAIERVIVFGGR